VKRRNGFGLIAHPYRVQSRHQPAQGMEAIQTSSRMCASERTLAVLSNHLRCQFFRARVLPPKLLVDLMPSMDR